MNRSQKQALGLGVIVIAAMVLYPPWNYTRFVPGRRAAVSTSPGTAHIPEIAVEYCTYAFLFDPPRRYRARLNVRRLLLQCGGVAVVTGLAVLRVRHRAGAAPP